MVPCTIHNEFTTQQPAAVLWLHTTEKIRVCEARKFNIVSSSMTLHCVLGETKVPECSSGKPEISKPEMLLITSSGSGQVAIYLNAHLPKVFDSSSKKQHYSTAAVLRPVKLTNAVAKPPGVKFVFLLSQLS